jgi:hypothetical protein
LDDRLPERISKHISPEPNSGCWLWMGNTAPNGYAKVGRRHDGGGWTTANVHREVYKIVIGEIPAGLDLDHKCRVRCCVNPSHLEPVTRQENMRRMSAAGFSNRQKMLSKTHCKRGHAFDEGNTRWFPSPATGRPARQCRACWTVARHRYLAKKREHGIGD